MVFFFFLSTVDVGPGQSANNTCFVYRKNKYNMYVSHKQKKGYDREGLLRGKLKSDYTEIK